MQLYILLVVLSLLIMADFRNIVQKAVRIKPTIAVYTFAVLLKASMWATVAYIIPWSAL